MYGIPKAGLLAQQMLEKHLYSKGYQQSELTPGWTHKWRPISLSLCVDNSGVKYNGKQNADHLIAVLKEYHTISQDWKGKCHLGLDIDWDYLNHVFLLSMIKYVANAIKHFHHKYPRKQQDQPYPTSRPSTGKKHNTSLLRKTPLSWHQQTKYL